MTNRTTNCCFLTLLSLGSLMLSLSALAQTTPDTMATGDLERSFRAFLQDYRPEMKRRNATYLKSVHPKLPDEMQDFFFDITLQMMRYSDERGLDPAIECQEFKVCKVVYPQPDGGWAAQRFILSDDRWRWLDQ